MSGRMSRHDMNESNESCAAAIRESRMAAAYDLWASFGRYIGLIWYIDAIARESQMAVAYVIYGPLLADT